MRKWVMIGATIIIGAAALSATHSASAQQQFTVGQTNVTVGVQPANSGDGYSVYHYRTETGPNSVAVTCSCPGAQPHVTANTCPKALYQCSCPSAGLVCD